MNGRRRTTTSNFGVGARESHDSSPFYARFRAPVLTDDDVVAAPAPVVEPFVCGDARHMDRITDASVALVVTSPPYFAGKQYEEELEREGVPSSYLEYLEMLTEVFTECVRTLEPGGRIAVNVANLGRKPYRSLSADVIGILEDRLGLLLRGELIWRKSEGASGSCAWGSYRRAANPVLRDVSERIVVASKGRFDRARSAKQRAAEGLPHRSTIRTDDFLSDTLDVWDLPPESARRVGHPAPFPVELPARLIDLYTYENDLVLDPFMGSGSAMVAAARLGRRYVGYDLDPGYVDIARDRVAAALADERGSEHDGLAAPKLAERALTDAGLRVVGRDRRIPGSGVSVSLEAEDHTGARWYFDVIGPSSTHRGGMQRTELVWKAIGRATAVRGADGDTPVVLLTTEPPRHRSEGDTALRAAGPEVVFDVVDLLAGPDLDRLATYARGRTTPVAGFWKPADLTDGTVPPDPTGL